MKYCSKWGARLLLVCYLAVSSTAGVHAFPSLPQNNSEAVDISTEVGFEATDVEMMADCHQQHQTSSQYSSSTCKIFCAAMASVISTEFSFNLSQVFISPEIAFTANKLQTYELGLEPHPPK